MSTFTKDMLIAGKHICEDRGGDRYMIMIGDDGLFMADPSNRCAWQNLDDFSFREDLTYIDDSVFDIIKIYTTKGTNFYDWEKLNLIWEREPELTQRQKKILELEETINKAKEQIEQLKKESK